MERVITPLVEWAVATRPLEAEDSGDAYVVHALPEGALVGVVDGLGHGRAAATASREAVRLLAGAELERPVAALQRCHEGLRSTRGVVLTLAWLDGPGERMTWLGVGNVLGVLLRVRTGAEPSRETLVGRGGIVGRQLPPLHARLLSISPGDLLVLATDGIHPRFTENVPRLGQAQKVADTILAEHCTGVDDALVLAVRYLGTPA